MVPVLQQVLVRVQQLVQVLVRGQEQEQVLPLPYHELNLQICSWSLRSFLLFIKQQVPQTRQGFFYSFS